MSDVQFNRRALIMGGAAAISWASLAGMPFSASAASGSAPYPVLGGGRLIPAALQDYENAMMSGGPPKDGIPAIDAPKFWSVEQADGFLDAGDVIFGIVENGLARAYPQRILVWHEIVNDAIGDLGLAVTYCPLTGTTIAFERGQTEFGVSGRLVNSNLIMYDRDTDTWFPQVLAVGIRGPHAGSALVERPMVSTTWQSWRSAHPETEVLSTDTGFARNYDRDPYGAYNPPSGYYAPDAPLLFPVMNEDERFQPKSVVIGARTGSTAVAFPLDRLRQAGKLELSGNSEAFTAIYDPTLDTGYVFKGRTVANAEMTGTGPFGISWSGGDALEPANSFEAMWFAWAAFYAESLIHE